MPVSLHAAMLPALLTQIAICPSPLHSAVKFVAKLQSSAGRPLGKAEPAMPLRNPLQPDVLQPVLAGGKMHFARGSSSSSTMLDPPAMLPGSVRPRRASARAPSVYS